MPYKKAFRLEVKYGKSMPEILSDLYSELGDHRPVAKRLGVTMKCLWQWRKEYGCETVVRVVCIPETDTALAIAIPAETPAK